MEGGRGGGSGGRGGGGRERWWREGGESKKGSDLQKKNPNRNMDPGGSTAFILLALVYFSLLFYIML